jgi:predicted acetyltransferase
VHWRVGLERDGWNDIRLLTSDDELIAGLVIHRTGQWFGGRRIASHAIGAVITAPHCRRRGAGRELMLRMLREARRDGVPLSVLYASTPTFYRGVGYEPAGQRCLWKIDVQHLPDAAEGGRSRPFSVEDRADVQAVRELYAAFAASHSGCVDRSDHFWRQHLNPYDNSKRYLYRIDFDGVLEGYLSLMSRGPDGVLPVQDVVCTTPRAARAALAFMRHHSSVTNSVILPDGPQGPLYKLIPENKMRTAYGMNEQWMLRITDVRAALAQRGYPPMDAEFHLDVRDASMPENEGPCVLRVRGGEASVETGGTARVRLDVRALTAIYTGFCHPCEMRDADLLEAPDDDIARLGQAFAGPSPFALDSF